MHEIARCNVALLLAIRALRFLNWFTPALPLKEAHADAIASMNRSPAAGA
jgi:hypothetical protein